MEKANQGKFLWGGKVSSMNRVNSVDLYARSLSPGHERGKPSQERSHF